MPADPPFLERRDPEMLRRRIYLLVAVLGCVSQLILAAINVLHHLPFWSSLYGALLAGAILPLISLRRFRLRWIDAGVLGTASIGLLIQLIGAFLSARTPEPQLYFIGTFLFVVAFSVLPIRWAGAYAVTLYTLYVGLTLARSDSPVYLIDLAVIVLLIAHFSVFGERVSGERAGSLAYQHLALTDPLTGLENRRAMYQRLEHALSQSKSGRSTAILLLDLDHFKHINDEYGHPVGDLVLQQVATVLSSSLRQGDTVARWGGEEFLMLIESPQGALPEQVVQRLLSSICWASMPKSLQVTASCGVCCSEEVESLTEWLALVDERLYAAKLGGRNQFRTT